MLYWKLDADKHETDPRLAAIRKVYNYSYTVRVPRVGGPAGPWRPCAAASRLGTLGEGWVCGVQPGDV